MAGTDAGLLIGTGRPDFLLFFPAKQNNATIQVAHRAGRIQIMLTRKGRQGKFRQKWT
ncbi:MAG: hypothetical protein LLG15_09335 [Betaproteobacteria bacterium]|nr:hypothetical protein [Betaproteobacteria bacterium]